MRVTEERAENTKDKDGSCHYSMLVASLWDKLIVNKPIESRCFSGKKILTNSDISPKKKERKKERGKK